MNIQEKKEQLILNSRKPEHIKQGNRVVYLDVAINIVDDRPNFTANQKRCLKKLEEEAQNHDSAVDGIHSYVLGFINPWDVEEGYELTKQETFEVFKYFLDNLDCDSVSEEVE